MTRDIIITISLILNIILLYLIIDNGNNGGGIS